MRTEGYSLSHLLGCPNAQITGISIPRTVCVLFDVLSSYSHQPPWKRIKYMKLNNQNEKKWQKNGKNNHSHSSTVPLISVSHSSKKTQNQKDKTKWATLFEIRKDSVENEIYHHCSQLYSLPNCQWFTLLLRKI